jgi:pimeloyl-ACP methyl ester carboxylesterase
MAAEPAVRRVELADVTLSVTAAGDPEAPTVVLLHGFPDRASIWAPQLAALAAAGKHVVAPDLRGFGDSDRPADVARYRMRDLVGDVTGVLDAVGADAADIVGHDWGAGLAWALAMLAPQRVRRLAVLSVGHPGTRAAAGFRQAELSWYMLWFLLPGVAEQVMPRDDWRFLRDWGWRDGADEQQLRQQVADLSREGALTAALNWYRANIDPRPFGAGGQPSTLPHVHCPTLGVWSDRDPFLGEQQMTASEQFVDAAWRYERVRDVDHWIPARAPQELSELLLDHLL